MGSPIVKRLSRNTLLLLISNVGTALLAFALAALIGRGLGTQGLGRYAAVMAWLLPLTQLADFGLNTLLTREGARQPRQEGAYLQQALRLRWAIGTVLILLLWLAAPLLSKDAAVVTGLRILAPMLLIDSIFGSYTALWRAREAMLPIPLLNILLLLMQVLGVALVLAVGAGLAAVLLTIVLADGLQLFLTWAIWRRWYRPPPAPSPAPAPLAMLRKALPFALAGVLGALQLRLVFLLLEGLLGASALGEFTAAQRFIEAARLPAFAFFGAVFPLLVKQRPQASMLWPMLLGLFFYAGLTLLLLATLGGPLLKLAFGGAFAGAAALLGWLALPLLPMLPRQHLTLLFYAQDRAGQANRYLLIGLLLQAAAGLLFISVDGLRGAAFSMLLAEGLLLALFAGAMRPAAPKSLLSPGGDSAADVATL